ncbi:MAG: RNase adapter RapZ [Oscillospiraceae bacterium]|nr:RNase adapter RapZ [Oscillospiraceae bacterium]MBR4578293.1 RNase adapter RapZ [Oscillospiraceae bacterium]MBR6208743.1 RNase adapter RapZ [Oscillospiraceae bacterium]
MEFLIVTGLSGAGKTQAANILEDLDYYCVDNMPTELLKPFAEFCLASQGRFRKVALVTDVRSAGRFEDLFTALESLRDLDCSFRILFIEAPVNVIVRRYKETRRPHPLAVAGETIQGAVGREIALMQPVRERADYIINTGSTNLSQLHAEISRLFAEGGKSTLPVNVIAFGYKYGIPLESDLVFDVRFLPNPYYIEELKSQSGLDQSVYDYVMKQPDAEGYAKKLCDLLDFLLPRFQEEGKTSLTVAVGCTGGRHRSVAMARTITDYLLEHGQIARLICRDMNRTGETS